MEKEYQPAFTNHMPIEDKETQNNIIEETKKEIVDAIKNDEGIIIQGDLNEHDKLAIQNNKKKKEKRKRRCTLFTD